MYDACVRCSSLREVVTLERSTLNARGADSEKRRTEREKKAKAAQQALIKRED